MFITFVSLLSGHASYISARDNLFFLDVQHYFREEQGKYRPSYCQSCSGWRRRTKEEEVEDEEEVVIPINACQVIQRFFHICTEQHLVLQDLCLTKIN